EGEGVAMHRVRMPQLDARARRAHARDLFEDVLEIGQMLEAMRRVDGADRMVGERQSIARKVDDVIDPRARLEIEADGARPLLRSTPEVDRQQGHRGSYSNSVKSYPVARMARRNESSGTRA